MAANTNSPPLNAGGKGLTVSQALGEIVWLMTQSPAHKQLFIGDLEWFVMPAILFEQFRLFYGADRPAAVALWASVTEETENRLKAGGSRLRPDEWRGGDRMWLIELVAPFGAEEEILKDLAVSIFGGKPFKFHHLTSDNRRVTAAFDPATGSLVH